MAADFPIFLHYVDLFISFLALIANIFFTVIIMKGTFMKLYCRLSLLLLSGSMYLLMTAKSLGTINLLREGFIEYESRSQYRASIAFCFNLPHEFGLAFQSFALHMFAIERYTSGSRSEKDYSCHYPAIWFSFFIFLSVILSAMFTISVNYYLTFVVPTLCMNALDFITLVIIILASRKSRLNYRGTVGVAPLERRFQMADVYKWSLILKRGAILASIVKFCAMIAAWSFIISSTTDNDTYYQVFFFRNVLCIYTIFLPLTVVLSDEKLKEKFLSCKKNTIKPSKIRTLEGNVINLKPSGKEYFELFKDAWK